MTKFEEKELLYFVEKTGADYETICRYIQEGIARDADKNPVGRPSKLTALDREYIFDLKEQGKTQEQIAYTLEISLSTVRRVLSQAK